MVVCLNNKIKDEHTDFLFKAIMSLNSLEECTDFFDDLCTIAEIKSMAQRLHVARLLKKQDHYVNIVAETGASTATISRVNRSYHYGSDGYKAVLERLEDK